MSGIIRRRALKAKFPMFGKILPFFPTIGKTSRTFKPLEMRLKRWCTQQESNLSLPPALAGERDSYGINLNSINFILQKQRRITKVIQKLWEIKAFPASGSSLGFLRCLLKILFRLIPYQHPKYTPTVNLSLSGEFLRQIS
ncbi:MAG: hypothetical protein WCG03_05765, partial [Kiritimatiellales bacterium]